MEKVIEFDDKAKEQERKAKYWEKKANEITLAMPESLDYFKYELEKAEEYHKLLKDNPERFNPRTCEGATYSSL